MPLTLTDMNQVRVTWSGFAGAPGVSTFYTDGSAVPNLTALRAFFNTLNGCFSSSVTITFPSSGDTLDPTDGTLIGGWSVGSVPAAVVGGAAGSVTSVQGPQIQWLTEEIADGHAIKGRTFIVPSMAGIFGNDGQLATSVQTVIYNAGATLRATSPDWVIWHRPKKGPKPTGGGPAPVVRAGGWAKIVGQAVPRTPVVLRSRRD
jgi:hypothetical protein